MFNPRFIALVGASLTLMVAAVSPAAAQTPAGTGAENEQSDRASGTVQGERVQPGRIGGGRQERTRDRGRQTGPTPEENRAAAQLIAIATNSGCQVSEANLLGARPEGGNVYEASCAAGPGFILIGTTPPTAADCVSLAGGAAIAKEQDPAADPGLQCVMPANQNAVQVVGDYARQAGVACQVDAGMAVAVNVYEVGCANADGFRIEKIDGSWLAIPCWDLALDGKNCRFSTEAESTGVWPAILAESTASGCDVAQARKMGLIDAQRLGLYEIRCASGDGFIVRIDTAGKAKRAQTCAEAVGVGGGCTLGTPPAAAPAEQ